MAEVLREIEINDEYLEISFEGNVSIEDASYSDEYGLVSLPKYWMVENISWNTHLYDEETNKIIDKYLNYNYTSIENEMIEEELNSHDFY